MPTLKLYSERRQQLETEGQPDVLQYDQFPNGFRVQVRNLWQWATGDDVDHSWPDNDRPIDGTFSTFWGEFERELCHEKGIERGLPYAGTAFVRCSEYLFQLSDPDEILDLIELSFRRISEKFAYLDRVGRAVPWIQRSPAEVTGELNSRFRQWKLGYAFENGQILCLDSEYLHAEAVKPALALLSDPRFAGPEQEFSHAHSLYRKGEFEDAIINAHKAFESTLKVICNLQKWPYRSSATATALIKVVIDENLVPSFLQSSIEGLATLRNYLSAHGQGQQVRTVPSYLAAHALHLSASNIVMLIEAFKGAAPNNKSTNESTS